MIHSKPDSGRMVRLPEGGQWTGTCLCQVYGFEYTPEAEQFLRRPDLRTGDEMEIDWKQERGSDGSA